MLASSPRFRRAAFLAAVAAVLALAAYASAFVISYGALFRSHDPLVVTDVGRLSEARVDRVVAVRTIDDIRSVLADAARDGRQVSIAGSRHSQGGQTFADGVVVLDMRAYDRILDVDSRAMTVTAESGASWDELQHALAPEGLALLVMQSSNVFTVGGSLSANAHGRDIDVTQLAEVVERFHLMLADGSVVEVGPEQNRELFSLVLGGYGLYGVILDVTLRVTPDVLLVQDSALVDYAEFPRYFDERIRSDPDAVLMIARPSIDPDPGSFLRELAVVTWRRAPSAETGVFALTEEEHVLRDRFFFSLSRRFDWAKALRWRLQKRFEPTLAAATVVSRNNAMRPPTAPLEFLAYESTRDTDILQEYFVPTDEIVSFMDHARDILRAADANVLSMTLRFVGPDDTTALPYAPEHESFAVVMLLNVGLSAAAQDQARSMTRELVEAALARGGTYYLTYQLYPTANQLLRAYPAAARAFARKRLFDPDERFTSRFYERYEPALAAVAPRP